MVRSLHLRPFAPKTNLFLKFSTDNDLTDSISKADQPLANTWVRLIRPNGQVYGRVKTNANGIFRFMPRQGYHYMRIRVVLESDPRQVLAILQTDVKGNGQIRLPLPPKRPVLICTDVWYDKNQDKEHDRGEKHAVNEILVFKRANGTEFGRTIVDKDGECLFHPRTTEPNQLIYVYNRGIPIRRWYLDDNGNKRFDLPLPVPILPTTVPGSPTSGVTQTTPTPPVIVTIPGAVFLDINRNCVFDSADLAFGGTSVVAKRDNGSVFNSAISDGSGRFLMTQVMEPSIQLTFMAPNGFIYGSTILNSTGGGYANLCIPIGGPPIPPPPPLSTAGVTTTLAPVPTAAMSSSAQPVASTTKTVPAGSSAAISTATRSTTTVTQTAAVTMTETTMTETTAMTTTETVSVPKCTITARIYWGGFEQNSGLLIWRPAIQRRILMFEHPSHADDNMNGVYEPAPIGNDVPYAGLPLNLEFVDWGFGSSNTGSNGTVFGTNTTQIDGFWYLETTTWAPSTEFVWINTDQANDPLGGQSFYAYGYLTLSPNCTGESNLNVSISGGTPPVAPRSSTTKVTSTEGPSTETTSQTTDISTTELPTTSESITQTAETSSTSEAITTSESVIPTPETSSTSESRTPETSTTSESTTQWTTTEWSTTEQSTTETQTTASQTASESQTSTLSTSETAGPTSSTQDVTTTSESTATQESTTTVAAGTSTASETVESSTTVEQTSSITAEITSTTAQTTTEWTSTEWSTTEITSSESQTQTTETPSTSETISEFTTTEWTEITSSFTESTSETQTSTSESQTSTSESETSTSATETSTSESETSTSATETSTSEETSTTPETSTSFTETSSETATTSTTTATPVPTCTVIARAYFGA